MGEPLNFVAGDEKLFKNYLRELLIILAIGEEGYKARELTGIACGGRLPTLDENSSWPLANAQITRYHSLEPSLRNFIKPPADTLVCRSYFSMFSSYYQLVHTSLCSQI